jgi:hypothetical protein
MHYKLYNFIRVNRELIIFSFLLTILVEICLHEFHWAAGLGVVGLILNSHVFCCLLPLGITALFHKKDCECHVHEGEEV